jgi:hypothetical protein
MNSLLQKANRLSTKKRDSKMNHKDALTAEEQRSSRETTTEAKAEATVTGGNQGESEKLSFLVS